MNDPVEIGGDDAVVVALGSNVAATWPSVEALLEAALHRFAAEGLTVVARSSWWRSKSWPDPTRPDYLNGVALVQTSLSPERTLAALRRIEVEFGRARAEPNAPRTLDLDLIAWGRIVLDTAELKLPHPRAAERLFVTGPLAEIARCWRHPVSGRTAAELASEATVGTDALPIG